MEIPRLASLARNDNLSNHDGRGILSSPLLSSLFL